MDFCLNQVTNRLFYLLLFLYEFIFRSFFLLSHIFPQIALFFLLFAPKLSLFSLFLTKICAKSALSADLFMQNEPNFKNVKINAIHYITNRYVNFLNFGKVKNEPKQSQIFC